MDSLETPLLTPAALSALEQDAFVAALDGVFEHSPWVAERAWMQRPFATRTALWQALNDAMLAASRDEQLALIRAHPELGTRGPLTPASGGEQQAAGLRQDNADTRRLAELNARYRKRFGHPFIVAVAGLGRDEILARLEQRLGATPEQEFAQCLAEIGRIAALRLAQRVSA
ncbi:2-oxo-4-hydroxy-4-carboxy-5-ureidoimidazoline decarboxylase [Pseudogulbenkiania sp. MAI-1]|uniref:2-oxo-4-hydroxy-4-carboxy-5-ureidoimidazoline decarboxylase n=1 Tax=Pseudogulbenkiania sp. MAI-1 TaxID=990370 RepID=UPI00045E5C87|nr:2-oxo-4-hydroxy-4-carboxy-5-ureidoimidazoline decarboxylase [Pseudogulbenkiania sp. MAI-1]